MHNKLQVRKNQRRMEKLPLDREAHIQEGMLFGGTLEGSLRHFRRRKLEAISYPATPLESTGCFLGHQ